MKYNRDDSSTTKSSFAVAPVHLLQRDQQLHHSDITVISRSHRDTIHFGTTVSATRAGNTEDTFTLHQSKHLPPFPPELPFPKIAISLHSRWICLSVLQPTALLGQRYFIYFISLSQSQLFKPWSCRFVKVCVVKPQPSGFLYRYKEAWHVLLTLQDHSRGIHFQLLCALVLGAEPGEPRVLQSSPWLCHGILQESSDSFSKEKAFVSEMLSLTSAPTKRFQTMGAEVS